MANKDITKLNIGENLFVEVNGNAKKRYRASLVGQHNEEYLIISPGTEDLRELLIPKGTELKLRVLTGSAALAFVSTTQGFAPTPEAHCFITYPTEVIYKEVRKAPRVSAKKINCQLKILDFDEQPPGLALFDLSTTGCSLQSDESLGKAGTAFLLQLSTKVGENAFQVEIPCIIRNQVAEEKEDCCLYRSGIEFKIMESEAAISLHSLVYQVLFNSSAL